jgi:hypothetical protein
MNRLLQAALRIGAGALLLGCSQGGGLDPSDRDYVTFRTEVMPVLLRDCGFHACHGSSARFFRVWGKGRVRLDPLTPTYADPVRPNDEYDYSIQSALSMVDFDNPTQSLLLRKPLAIEAGGSDHGGADKYGRNVYRTVNDKGYLSLTKWVVTLKPNQKR